MSYLQILPKQSLVIGVLKKITYVGFVFLIKGQTTMKTFSLISTAILLASSLSLACVTTQSGQQFCSGDLVTVNAETGSVIEIDEAAGTIKIQLELAQPADPFAECKIDTSTLPPGNNPHRRHDALFMACKAKARSLNLQTADQYSMCVAKCVKN